MYWFYLLKILLRNEISTKRLIQPLRLEIGHRWYFSKVIFFDLLKISTKCKKKLNISKQKHIWILWKLYYIQ
jgi:hypothetical protein